MLFTETKLHGVYTIEPEPLQDEIGFLVGLFCQEEFKSHGLNFRVTQCSFIQ